MDERRLWRLLGPDADTTWERIATVCEMVREHVHVDAAAVSVPSEGWGTTVATDQWAEGLEDYQHTLGEGPSADVLESGLAVLAPDVLAKRSRWPVFTERAAERGLAAVFAVPIPNLHGNTVGTLALYRRTTGPLSVAELRHTAIMAGFTAKLLDLDDDPATFEAGHTRSTTIAAATNLLARRHTITQDDALVLLRAHAFAQDRPLHEVAAAIVNPDG